MNDIVVTAASALTQADLASAQLGGRFGRLDLISQLALLAVEPLAAHFDLLSRDRIGICLAVRAGSLSTDVEYWKGRDAVGGPSPMLFAYTLPSSAIGEIAIRHRLTGPNLCFVGDDALVLSEAVDWLRRGEADACICVYCDVVTAAAAEVIQETSSATACALFLMRGSNGFHVLRENDRDMKLLCAKILSQKPACPK
jgi:3-oxoacyl-(acyl-carrier-protein) synthase